MAADILVSCLVRPSAVLTLTVCSMDILVSLECNFKKPATFQCQSMMSNVNMGQVKELRLSC